MPKFFVSQPLSPTGTIARSPQGARRAATALARRTGRPAHIHATVSRRALPGLFKGRLLAVVPPPRGLSGTLTDWACDSAAHSEDWRVRVGSVMSTGATAAVIGAGAAGLLGGLLKRPLLGTFIGAATGWAAHAIWTAPLQAGD